MIARILLGILVHVNHAPFHPDFKINKSYMLGPDNDEFFGPKEIPVYNVRTKTNEPIGKFSINNTACWLQPDKPCEVSILEVKRPEDLARALEQCARKERCYSIKIC